MLVLVPSALQCRSQTKEEEEEVHYRLFCVLWCIHKSPCLQRVCCYCLSVESRHGKDEFSWSYRWVSKFISVVAVPPNSAGLNWYISEGIRINTRRDPWEVYYCDYRLGCFVSHNSYIYKNLPTWLYTDFHSFIVAHECWAL